MKIILDTNVIYSALYSKNGASYQVLTTSIAHSAIITCASVSLICEYEAVLKRKFEHNFVDQFLRSYIDLSEKVLISYRYRPTGCDNKDEMVLEAAINCAADYIVTHNIKDFKGAKNFNVEVITPQQFLKILKEIYHG
ncbi:MULTISPECIES: putative toxin-antitoxin system toxin component, PIN family [Cysteiniphilum]|uniref:putative toxin-antitoxin system toxin component, PIN family n=1 Tax=Cysteiniphilum TaxID=2056696 RepID=UPI0017875CD4|nr:putative toxin-antitoxin system toxin component, PIN family [Cysteiniphilum marinum]